MSNVFGEQTGFNGRLTRDDRSTKSKFNREMGAYSSLVLLCAPHACFKVNTKAENACLRAASRCAIAQGASEGDIWSIAHSKSIEETDVKPNMCDASADAETGAFFDAGAMFMIPDEHADKDYLNKNGHPLLTSELVAAASLATLPKTTKNLICLCHVAVQACGNEANTAKVLALTIVQNCGMSRKIPNAQMLFEALRSLGCFASKNAMSKACLDFLNKCESNYKGGKADADYKFVIEYEESDVPFPVPAVAADGTITDSGDECAMNKLRIAKKGTPFASLLTVIQANTVSEDREVFGNKFKIDLSGVASNTLGCLMSNVAPNEAPTLKAKGVAGGTGQVRFTELMPPGAGARMVHNYPDHAKAIWQAMAGRRVPRGIYSEKLVMAASGVFNLLNQKLGTPGTDMYKGQIKAVNEYIKSLALTKVKSIDSEIFDGMLKAVKDAKPLAKKQ